MMAPGGPFWVMCIAFIFTGYGISLQNAQGNGYVGNMKERAHVYYGFMHASYGMALWTDWPALSLTSVD